MYTPVIRRILLCLGVLFSNLVTGDFAFAAKTPEELLTEKIRSYLTAWNGPSSPSETFAITTAFLKDEKSYKDDQTPFRKFLTSLRVQSLGLPPGVIPPKDKDKSTYDKNALREMIEGFTREISDFQDIDSKLSVDFTNEELPGGKLPPDAVRLVRIGNIIPKLFVENKSEKERIVLLNMFVSWAVAVNVATEGAFQFFHQMDSQLVSAETLLEFADMYDQGLGLVPRSQRSMRKGALRKETLYFREARVIAKSLTALLVTLKRTSTALEATDANTQGLTSEMRSVSEQTGKIFREVKGLTDASVEGPSEVNQPSANASAGFMGVCHQALASVKETLSLRRVLEIFKR